MEKVHFLLGVHNHQPIGNFDFVFEKAYARSYLPFLEAMDRHPRLHWNLHATGILWEWLEAHHPEYLNAVHAQVKRGQLELLTGGYYEPILPALPDPDKAGQIKKLTSYLQKRFRVEPQGMWLAERVWEPHLTKVLHDSGVRYTLVDDSHFLTTGMSEDQMTGPYLTEEQGATVTLLPIRKDLRYAIPFKPPEETFELLRRFKSPGGRHALVMFDDGEKFGLWPDTYEHVWDEGWLETFLTQLEANADWIACSRISDYLAQTPPHGRVYLPTSSYYEMSEWTLPATSQETLMDVSKHLPHDARFAAAKRFLRGGYWRNFLTKYEESNTLHKKMLWVSEKVRQAEEKIARKTPAKGEARQGRTAAAQKMLESLWAGQCNCAYWHGVFGGLYLPHLRQALYQRLLTAESMADDVLKSKPITVEHQDFDKDGRTEVLFESPTQNLYLAPHAGGSIFEWDLRAEGVNLLNVLTRRPEGYHRQLLEAPRHAPPAGAVKTIHDQVRSKEPGLEKRLYTDWYRRASLLDHFLHPDTTLQDFFRCQYGEQGDFVNTEYAVDVVNGKSPQIKLHREGSVWTGDQRNTIRVEKTLSFTTPLGWEVIYRIRNVEGPACDLWFGSEMGFAFSSQALPEPVDLGESRQWQRRDHGLGLAVSAVFDQPTPLWEFPLETISLSEEGFERTYQGTVLLAHMRCRLKPGQTFIRSWRIEVNPS